MTAQSPWRRRLFGLGLLLGGAIFLWQAVAAAQALQAQTLVLARPAMIVVGAGCVLVVTALQIGAWRAIMLDLGVSLDWSASVRGYMLPFIARYIPGMVWGYLSRTHWLATRHGTSARVANLGAVIEVVGLILSAALVSALCGGLARVPAIAGIGLVAAAAISIGIAVSAQWVGRPGRLRDLAARVGVADWLSELTLRRVAVALPWQVGLWLGYGAAIYCLIGAVAVWTSQALAIAIAAFALAWLAGFLAILLPSGLGLRELGLTYLLSGYAGLTQSEATAVSVLGRVCVLIGELLFIVLALILDRRARSDSAGATRDQDV